MCPVKNDRYRLSGRDERAYTQYWTGTTGSTCLACIGLSVFRAGVLSLDILFEQMKSNNVKHFKNASVTQKSEPRSFWFFVGVRYIFDSFIVRREAMCDPDM